MVDVVCTYDAALGDLLAVIELEAIGSAEPIYMLVLCRAWPSFKRRTVIVPPRDTSSYNYQNHNIKYWFHAV